MGPHSFMADPDPAVLLNADPAAFLMRIRVKLKLCLKFLNTIAIITGTNFLTILMLFFNFSLLDPDPHIECGYGSRR